MDNLAHKLMYLDVAQQTSQAPSAIFGTAGSLSQSLGNRPAFRIGMWPCISKSHPEVAMGFFTALAMYLERWQSIRVYHLFINYENASEDFAWDISKSQFEVEQWHVEGLDENVGLWGTLSVEGDQWKLNIDLEYDNALGDAEEISLSFEKSSLVDLINSIPEITEKLVDSLDISGVTTDMGVQFDSSDAALELLLKDVFNFEVMLELSLWGRGLSENDVVRGHEDLILAGKRTRNEFSAWCVASLTAQAMKPGFLQIASLIGDRALLVVEEFSDFPSPTRVIASALYRAGRVQEGIKLLEKGTKEHPRDPNIWITLAESERVSGKLNEALDTFQSAIEEEAVNFITYVRYASLLVSMLYDSWDIEAYVLCDIDKVKGNLARWEIVEAYEEALKLRPDQVEILEQQIYQLVELGAFDRAIKRIKQLNTVDDGDAIRRIIDSLYDLYGDKEDVFVDDVVSILRQYANEEGDIKSRTTLASAYILIEDNERARTLLETIQTETEDKDILADVLHLLLLIDDPDFEMRLTEMRQILDAGNNLSLDDVDYLEDTLERVPTMTELYVLLSKAYLAMGEDENALETLLDGHKEVPNTPEIIVDLANLLWDTDEDELALDYLAKALEVHPNSVPILANLGLFSFEVEDRDEARSYLARAEALDPRHPDLVEARVKITQFINEEGGE
ncbi:MAG: tetratricopeptide repeat protein [Aggregatilineales bacterium]